MKRYILTAVIVLAGLLCSCSDEYLNPLPTDSVSDEQIFSSVDAAQTALNAAFRFTGRHLSMTLDYIASDLMGENAICTNGNYGRPTYGWHELSYSFAEIPSEFEPEYVWEYYYKAIDQANSIIANADEMPDSKDKENLVAQAHAIRAHAFLRLTWLYAPAYSVNKDAPAVILRTEPANAASDHMPRASLSAVYGQIVDDLKYAVSHCNADKREFITPRSASLLLARAYLDMEDYANAKACAETAAAGVFDGSNLMSQEQWKDGFRDRNDEWLWFFYYTPETCNIYASIPSFYYHTSGYTDTPFGGKANLDNMDDDVYAIDRWDGYGTIRWTQAFVNSFEDSDVRKRFPFYFDEMDGYYTSKFNHRTMMGDAEFPMCRIAEAYLIKAECELRNGSAATAKSVLNALQTARGASATEATDETIYQERQKEFYGEGLYLNDIKRLHKPVNRSGYREHWSKLDLPAGSNRLMFPIPESEMLHNKALSPADQNEYWR